MPVPSQDHMQAAIAKPPMRLGSPAQHLAQGSIVRSLVQVSHRRPIRTDQGTRPPLAHLVALFEMGYGLAPGGGR
jgi:hypothetical protein